MNGHLFEIMHLLIIRERLSQFNVHYKQSSNDIDLVLNTGQLNNSILLEYLFSNGECLGDQFLDTMNDVDINLKRACNNFFRCSVQFLIPQISDFNNDIDRNQIEPNQVQLLIDSDLDTLRDRVEKLLCHMKLYLIKEDIISILFQYMKVICLNFGLFALITVKIILICVQTTDL